MDKEPRVRKLWFGRITALASLQQEEDSAHAEKG